MSPDKTLEPDEIVVGSRIDLFPQQGAAVVVLHTIDPKHSPRPMDTPALLFRVDILRQFRDDLSEAIAVLESNPGQGRPT